MGIETINTVVMVSGGQRRDSATHTHVPILPHTPPVPAPVPDAAGPGSGAALLLQDGYGSSSVEVPEGRSGPRGPRNQSHGTEESLWESESTFRWGSCTWRVSGSEESVVPGGPFLQPGNLGVEACDVFLETEGIALRAWIRS